MKTHLEPENIKKTLMSIHLYGMLPYQDEIESISCFLQDQIRLMPDVINFEFELYRILKKYLGEYDVTTSTFYYNLITFAYKSKLNKPVHESFIYSFLNKVFILED